MGARPPQVLRQVIEAAFQSTRPAWGRDTLSSRTGAAQMYFNPRAPHGGATRGLPCSCSCLLISIHAPRMGARRKGTRIARDEHGFQSTRPAWGRDGLALCTLPLASRFQSTRPAWGRDQLARCAVADLFYFNPRAPHGGATHVLRAHIEGLFISIHAPRMGARRWTIRNFSLPYISIHAPRMGARLR